MIRIIDNGVYLVNKQLLEVKNNDSFSDLKGKLISKNQLAIASSALEKENAQKKTISYKILEEHNTSQDEKDLKIRFDALTSHDITYVGIVQTARASGLKEFPLPYVLTNCHNSLCAVGGTINEDDHVFGLSAAQKYGGIYVPSHLAVIHQYIREMTASCGNMIIGSDSHTRYGALGTMGIGEGGPELVKQLLDRTYDIRFPEIIAVYLEGQPKKGVGPQDVALAIIGAVFKSGFVNNKVLEFVGPGIHNLSMDFRNGIDVMTTETTCLSSIWMTDEKVKEYYEIHGRPEGYKKLEPGDAAYYDGAVVVDLDKIEPMIALPFHPSNAYKISDLNNNLYDILKKVEDESREQIGNSNYSLTDKIVDGRLKVDQAVVAGCAGGSFENLVEVSSIIDQHSVGNQNLALNVYPASQPVYLELVKNGAAEKLMLAGSNIKTAFCGPCFGAGDVPANNSLSIRHTTRNFPSREGSKPGEGQIASVALMDARSIAATVVNGGFLTAATEIDYEQTPKSYNFDSSIYANRVYNGFKEPESQKELQFGPNIADWPAMISLPENLLLSVASVIKDPVTTTDELIPSGETSSYRSNPFRLAEFTLSRKDPNYVGRAKDIQTLELERQNLMSDSIATSDIPVALRNLFSSIKEKTQFSSDIVDLLKNTGIGTVIYAVKPGDGSAREQAASCQKVLGGWANIANGYATKRYRSNLINWGMLPFTIDNGAGTFKVNDYIFIQDIRQKLSSGAETIEAQLISDDGTREITLYLNNLSKDERDIILEGSLINYYASR